LGKASARCKVPLRSRRRVETPWESKCLATPETKAIMIKNFSDHAANERTFLAWVRTAIAIMTFGFLVERFDLFLVTVAPSMSGRMLSPVGQRFGNIAGLALIVAGTAMVAFAMIRFIRNARDIDSDEEKMGSGSRLDVALASLLILLGISMFLYLSHAFIPTI
jgi:putative membrane protein